MDGNKDLNGYALIQGGSKNWFKSGLPLVPKFFFIKKHIATQANNATDFLIIFSHKKAVCIKTYSH